MSYLGWLLGSSQLQLGFSPLRLSRRACFRFATASSSRSQPVVDLPPMEVRPGTSRSSGRVAARPLGGQLHLARGLLTVTTWNRSRARISCNSTPSKAG
jgi:hypothetical protein